MNFETFCSKIREYAASANVAPPVCSHHDGKHIARFKDEGVTITGNTQSPMLSVSWGSGHRALAS